MKHFFVYQKAPENTPTEKVPDGPLTGNGDIGVVVAYPQPGELRFCLGKNDIWNSDSRWETPGVRGYGAVSIRCPQAAGDFRAEQRMADGTILVDLSAQWGAIRVETSVLRKTNLMVQTVDCLRGKCRIQVNLQHTSRGEEVQTQVRRQGNEILGVKAYVGSKYLWPLEVCSLTKVFGKEDLEFFLEPGERVQIWTALVTNQDGEAPEALCRRWIRSDLEPLEKTHRAWWERFWAESAVSLPTQPEIEKFWYASQYLMACCCEEGKFAPGIFGNWVTTDYPAWGGDYHLNYNYEAPFWGLYSSNHVALTDCYDQPLLDYMERSRKAAKEKLNCSGLYTLVGIGPKGLRTAALEDKNGNDDANYWGQKSNAAYAAVNMFLRYYATYDRDYADKIYPYVKECADFWLDYLSFEDGRYMDRDDCIIENSKAAVGVFDWAEEDWCQDLSGHVNPLLTMGLLRMLFQGLLDLYPEDPLCGKWRHVLDHLPDFPTMERNGKTVFRLTEEGMDWNTSNSLETQHIYPVGCVGLGSGPGLLEIGRETFRQMDRWDDYNAFPTYFPAAARLGLPAQEILLHLKEQIQKHGYPNGFLFYGGGGIECCSGVPVTVNEMLLQSHQGVLRVFPVWREDASFQNLRADGAFLVSASQKNGKVQKLQIISEQGRPCAVCLPHPGNLRVQCQGEPVAIEQTENIYHFQTQKNKIYEMSV